MIPFVQLSYGLFKSYSCEISVFGSNICSSVNINRISGLYLSVVCKYVFIINTLGNVCAERNLLKMKEDE